MCDAPDRPDAEVDHPVTAVHKVLQCEEDTRDAAHHEHGGGPSGPRNDEQEEEETANGDEQAERREPAGEAEEEVRAVYALRTALWVEWAGKPWRMR